MQGIDKIGVGLYIFITLFGIINVYSVNSDSGIKQALWFGISIFVGTIIFINRIKFFENMAIILYTVGILLLMGLFPFGTEINGQKNWYRFGGIQLQPVEFMKLAISLMLASFCSQSDFSFRKKKYFWTSIAIIALPGFFIVLQPDVGSLIIFIAFFIALYREGLSGWIFAIGFVFISIFLLSLLINPINIILGILLITILIIFLIRKKISWNIIIINNIILSLGIIFSLSYFSPHIVNKLPKHQRERIEVLFKGEKLFRNTAGYNLLYSKTAIGSGGFLGKGFKQGSVTQGKFVPEQRTDYIFCTVGEEWGFLGSTLLVIIYALYIGRIYILSERQKNTFNRIFGYCFASTLFMHFIINIGMVMGLFPTVGIPLPYFSYGGSSLLSFSISTAIFFKLHYDDLKSLI